MKKSIITVLFPLAILMACNEVNQLTDISEINDVVELFVQATDKGNLSVLDSLLHEDYRNISTSKNSSGQSIILDKKTFLRLVKDGVLGGKQCNVTIAVVDKTNNNACVKAYFRGADFQLTSYLFLKKSDRGEWQLISDLISHEKTA